MRLCQLAGQDHAVTLLLRALERGRLAHALLFDGPDGVGKRSAAVGLGLALVCPEAPGDGCGTCDLCRRVLAGNHPDVRVITPATAQILIEQAQDIVTLASSRPHEAPARVIVLDDADRLNPNAANALLKTLEEPFPGTHLVLVTAAPERLLPTIRSRTQRVRFAAVRPATLVQIAVARGADAARAETAAALGGGSVARTLELVAAESDESIWDAITMLRRAAAGREMGAVFDAAASVGDKEGKEVLPEILVVLAGLYRDALAMATGAADVVLLRERQADLEALAGASRRTAGLLPLRRALGAVLATAEALGANVNAVTAVESMLLDMRPCERQAA